jgi:two-component sensor histidine kinase/amino acid transporter
LSIIKDLQLTNEVALSQRNITPAKQNEEPKWDQIPHPRTVGWFGTTAVAMGGINQSLFLLGALFAGQGAIPGQGSAAVPLLIVGLLLSWAATPGWLELILMYPNRVGGIAGTCAEAFRPYSPVLANLTGVCYWWGWIPTCGLTAILSASAINQWYLPGLPVPLLASLFVVAFTVINLCGVKWVMRLAIPVATISAILAFLSAVIPVFSGDIDWQQAFTFQLTVPFPGWFGQVTSVMAGLYLIGFAAPAFEQATCHVGETIDPNRNVPRAVFASAVLASLYFVILPIIWLGTLGPAPLGRELANELGPTFAPLLGGAAKSAAIWFMIFNMLHGTLAPLAGAARTLAQLAEDGLLPESLARRSRTDAPWVATILTAGMAIAFLLLGDPIWLLAAANLTYLIGIAMPNVAVWLLRNNEPDLPRPYRAPRGTIGLGLFASGVWALTAVLGFQQYGLKTVLVGIVFAYSGSVLYAWRKFSDRRKAGLSGIARTLHLKLTGAMLLVLVLDALGYLIAVDSVPTENAALIALLEDIFVIVALLTIAVGLILPGMIAHSAVEVSKAADALVGGTLADFTKAMRALAAGDLNVAKTRFDLVAVKVFSRDEVGDMALSFNLLQEEIGRAAIGLDGAREGLSKARTDLVTSNSQLTLELAERKLAEEALQSSLLEKEALLREVHHRVKNNLQVINSLLRMEARRSAQPDTKEVLRDVQGRIESMALLHETLYRSGTLAAVELGAYLKQLAAQSFRALTAQPSPIQLYFKLTSAHVSMDQALPCGLMVNELVSNCLKHGFPDAHSGEVWVELHTIEDTGKLRLLVRDTGVGLPADFEAKRGTSLGLHLVAGLASQLGGVLEVGAGPAAVFTVTFMPDSSKSLAKPK